MFSQVGWGELLVLALVGLFVFGPERLPRIAADAARTIRTLRKMAHDATADLRAELGPEIADLDLASLHPKRLVRDHLLGGDLDDDPPVARARAATTSAPASGTGATGVTPPVATGAAASAGEPGQRPRFDPDAT